MNDTRNLKELVQKAAAGDKESFEKLYQETCRSVYFTCLGLLKDEQEAQDITQDVYMTVFEQIGTLEDAGKFKAWLYRIAANKSMKHLRKKQPILSDNEQLEDMETEENENFLPEEYALNADKRKLVLEITRKVCTDVQYQTILLYYFNELSVAEIAEVMECLEGTVKNRLSVARQKIKEGVLRYEKKSGDKLYSVAVIPFLTTLFTAQMQDIPMPSFPLRFTDAIPQSKLAVSSAKTGGRIMLKGLQAKIIAGIIAAAVVVGGVTAAAVLTSQDAAETSADGQEGNTPDAANAGNTENTPESDTQPTEAEEPQENEEAEEPGTAEEVKAEEVTTPEESETTKTASGIAPEQTAEPEQKYTYTDMSATMYATQTVNIRTLPDTAGDKVGSLSVNQEVNVTGQCNETGWYRFEYDGQTAYVSNNYISDTKIEVAAAEPAANTESASAQETANANTSSGLPAGVLDLTTLPREQWVDRGDWLVYVHGVWDEYPAVGDLGPLMASFQTRHPDAEMSAGACKFLKDLGISVVWMQFKYGVSPEADTTLGYYSKYGVRP